MRRKLICTKKTEGALTWSTFRFFYYIILSLGLSTVFQKFILALLSGTALP